MTVNIEKYKIKKAKDFNILTYIYQLYVAHIVFGLCALPFYRIIYKKNKNIDKTKSYILAPNHMSGLDVFLIALILSQPIAYMAKHELFEQNNYIAKNMSRLGAFPVNREKPKKSTIISALEALKTKFHLCIFPQGIIRTNKKIENIKRGFVYFAKLSKRDILPIGLNGAETYDMKLFTRKVVTVSIGTPISYLKSEEEIFEEWKKQISDLTGYEIVR